MDKQINKIPQVRFPDFKDDWEVKKFDEIGSRITKKNTEFAVKLVLTNSATKGIISQTDFFDKKIANNVNLNNYYIADIDDFVYNPRISKYAPVGPLKRNKLEKGVLSPLYTVLRFNEGDLSFFEHYFETIYWYKYLRSVANYGARHDRMNITNDNFIKLPIPFPPLPEQKKIAYFFTTIDQKINQLQEKKNALEHYKKGMMQKIFSQQLRFKDNNEQDFPDWEVKKLGEVTNYTKGFAFKSSNYSDIGSRIIRVSDLGASKIKSNCNKIFIDKSRSKEFIKYKLIEGDIIITTVGSNPELRGSSVGRGILVTEDNLGFLNQNLLKFNVNSEFNNEFIYGFINTDKYFHYIKTIKRGNANQANITVVDLLDYKISIPNLKEQTKIANFLSKIDEKINAVNAQIEKTKTYKKGLLQKMFV